MEKRSRPRTRDLVTQAASQGLSENEIGCARISMMAGSDAAPSKGRIQKRKTNPLQIVKSSLQRTAGPYSWVKRRNARCEQMFSALAPTTDFAQEGRHVRSVPILLQKSACRRRGTAGAIFEAVRCHPLDCAGDLRSTLLTLATLTQRTKERTVVAGRPTWQACGGSEQSQPT